MNSPENLNRHFEIYEDDFFKIIWEFNFNNKKKIRIEYFFYYESHIFKIVYNEKIIIEEKNKERFNLYSFIKEGHNYSIIHDYRNYIHGLIIDNIVVDKFPSKFFWKKLICNGLKEKNFCNINFKAERESSEEEKKFFINIKFFNKENSILYPKKDLSGLLNLCLIKYMSDFFDNKLLENISPKINKIILKLRKNINFTEDNKENIKLLLKENNGNNILIYSQYVNMIINKKEVNYLFGLLNKDNQDEINKYWGCISKYDEYNSFFEKEFQKDLKNTIFDYSLISLGILEKNDEEDYKTKRDSCPNSIKRILYHGSQIDFISSILTDEFKYAKKPFYDMGIYFGDLIDYIYFYSGGTNLKNRRQNFRKTAAINSTFSFIASEVFYYKKKFKQIKDKSLLVHELKDFPSYNYLKRKFPDKMIEPNGIHFIRS